MSEKLHVNEPAGLMVFLSEQLQGWARSKIKQRLQTGCVSVNGSSTTQHDYALNAGDLVEVGATAKTANSSPSQLEILYSDRDVIAINKPAGLLSVGNPKETQQHALAILRKQLSHRTQAIKLWPVNRIDRDTSGVLLFATSREMREAVMDKWDQAEKTYLAIVEGCPTPAQGTIDQPLRLDEVEYRMYVGAHPDAKLAITHYKTERTSNARTLLQVQIDTGRQHQIRAHLSWLGYPVVGDERYGTKGSRMGLHALRLKIIHPKTGKELMFETPAPADFFALMNQINANAASKKPVKTRPRK
ncbi:RluA family pseudouridine synthase [Cellvibrio sp. OA-2007]|uniref:RluA family pseudouridine synthase n=1 Tax=Cellvibrio sp. OA-2007 TaxID=529823 RepID=UPI0007852B3C|nr:RluA family pseudouridine synthase [Cellvibrio sp. OA-2007]